MVATELIASVDLWLQAFGLPYGGEPVVSIQFEPAASVDVVHAVSMIGAVADFIFYLKVGSTFEYLCNSMLASDSPALR